MIYDITMRTIVDLHLKQLKALEMLCEKEKISRAEAIRRAVGRFLPEGSISNLETAFGMWKHKRIDSRKYVEHLRSEWTRHR